MWVCSMSVVCTNLIRIFCHELAEIMPKLMLALALLRRELLIVDDVTQFDSSLVQSIILDEIIDKLFGIFGTKLHVTAIHSQAC